MPGSERLANLLRIINEARAHPAGTTSNRIILLADNEQDAWGLADSVQVVLGNAWSWDGIEFMDGSVNWDGLVEASYFGFVVTWTWAGDATMNGGRRWGSIYN